MRGGELLRMFKGLQEIRAVLDELLLRCDGITLGAAEVTYPNLTTNMSIYDQMPVTLTAR